MTALDRSDVALDDHELVRRMARGDRAALGAIYARHAPRLLALVRHIVGDRAEAEDVLHDIFLEAWRRAGDYSSERGSVAAWLAVRARSRALDRRRAPLRRGVTLASSVSEAEPSDAEPPSGTNLAEQARLRAALSSMAAEERQVIVLGYFAGLSSREIAEEARIPVGTVKSRVRSALIKLRAWFANDEVAP